MMNQYNDDEVFSKINQIIQEALRVDPDRIKFESRIFSDLGAESLDILDIRFRIEQLFGFKITDGEIVKRIGKNLSRAEIEEQFTVGSLVDFIKSRCKKEPAV